MVKQKTMGLDEKELTEIANQLRCPKGKDGIAMGELLNETNRLMIEESVNFLELEDKNRILELGHGSCMHLNYILSKANELKYFGMEISKTMKTEAEKINKTSINNRRALFQVYDGCTIPYVSNFFDRILLVNTIYFLREPLLFLEEMYRVLKPGGVFVISFADKNFMKSLPFVTGNNIFNLFDNSIIEDLIEKTDFILNDIKEETEKVKSKTGELVERVYFVVSLRKKIKRKKIKEELYLR